MSHPPQSSVRAWWRTALLFVLLVVFVNVVISFILSKVYPSHCVRSSQVPSHIQQESVEILEDPRQLYLHVDTPLLPLAEKDIVVRSAYLNVHHHQSLEYENSTIILLEIRKSLLDEGAFESCGVGGYASSKFEVK